MISIQTLKAPSSIALCRRLLAGIVLLMLVPAVNAQEPPKAVTDLGSQDEIRQFCTNIADAAKDQRYLIQKQELEKLQSDVDQRIAVLEKRKVDYEDWLKRRNDFLARAEEGLVDIYKTMKADAAAPQIQAMKMEVAAAIIMKLPARQSGLILSEMDAQKAAMVASIIAQASNPKTSKDPS
jgi:flagellar motility protein MotE (MotC chaperone)